MKAKSTILAFKTPDSPIVESFRLLRTNLMYRNFEKDMQIINITSTNPSEGKSTTTLNLAAVYSQLEKKVLVIDMDLRNPSLHKKLKYKNSVGVSDIVTGNAKLETSILHYTDYLDVIFAGTKIPFAAEFIQSKALREFIEKMRSLYDMVFIDCPPVGLVTDGAIISNMCDGTLFVVASGKDDRQELAKSKEILDQMNVNVLGTVFTHVPQSKKSYYYGYGYGQSETSKPKKKASKLNFLK